MTCSGEMNVPSFWAFGVMITVHFFTDVTTAASLALAVPGVMAAIAASTATRTTNGR